MLVCSYWLLSKGERHDRHGNECHHEYGERKLRRVAVLALSAHQRHVDESVQHLLHLQDIIYAASGQSCGRQLLFESSAYANLSDNTQG